MSKETRCRHRDSWLISGGSHEWCYRCGALRQCRETGIAEVTPRTPWVTPTGQHGYNPFSAWNKRVESYQRRHGSGTGGPTDED